MMDFVSRMMNFFIKNFVVAFVVNFLVNFIVCEFQMQVWVDDR